jgi:predicted dehydrogenase/threonine dehydrogenase-like Zn-dependent dehydrogenase
MKQVLQNLNDGSTILADVPAPAVRSHHLLIKTRMTLVSAGTERMLLEFGKANLIEKARQQPEKVRTALDKAKTDGILPTLEAVRRKLDEPLPMGYCNVGTVLEVGAGAVGFSVGDRVASNGKHAEITSVPANLCARVPGGISDEDAAFTVIGAIALQSIRLAEPTIGEAFAVVGLGLVGLLTVALLRANGCRVLALDPDPNRVAIAGTYGAETLVLTPGIDPLPAALTFSRGRGVDGVIIAASTRSDAPIHQAATMCRQRGRIILVGVIGLELSRADFYEKELRFAVSCSYGPGRYDPAYEEGGADYPFGFVRWTAQRNFEAILDLLQARAFDVAPLITHRFPFAQAQSAYDVLGGTAPNLGILLDARNAEDEASIARTVIFDEKPERRHPHSTVALGFIGSGQYASGILIPAFKAAGANLRTIACNTGVSGAVNAKKYGFKRATTEPDTVFHDREIDAIAIATRHDSHARLVCQALRAGKSVFVEKPVAVTRDGLTQIELAYAETRSAAAPLLMVGFNRRFAPHVQIVHRLLRQAPEVKSFIMTVNAGAIPRKHWLQDPAVGGGRIIGEACHFIDLLRFLAGAPIVATRTVSLAGLDPLDSADKATIELRFADGSIGAIHYFANGHRSFPKERLEIFTGGRILQLNNYRELRAFGWPKIRKIRSWRQDKGQGACVRAFLEALREGKAAPIPFSEIIEVARATFDAADQARDARSTMDRES